MCLINSLPVNRKDPSFDARDILKVSQERNFPWLELPDDRIDTTGGLRGNTVLYELPQNTSCFLALLYPPKEPGQAPEAKFQKLRFHDVKDSTQPFKVHYSMGGNLG
ncbi:uncharacterized protein LOC129759786 [Uranotaenia lowii]|uniref:uncharacterized protein LOC129759786 n=1 Tax=Uranotaenia lowii TaxID=190385 RepID=UPI0024787237|nr:uncharacterized protein LOC129759786 [Uranotaenia lowii]